MRLYTLLLRAHDRGDYILQNVTVSGTLMNGENLDTRALNVCKDEQHRTDNGNARGQDHVARTTCPGK